MAQDYPLFQFYFFIFTFESFQEFFVLQFSFFFIFTWFLVKMLFICFQKLQWSIVWKLFKFVDCLFFLDLMIISFIWWCIIGFYIYFIEVLSKVRGCHINCTYAIKILIWEHILKIFNCKYFAHRVFILQFLRWLYTRVCFIDF